MKLIDASVEEVAVIDMLQRTGPCSLDDLVRFLPNFYWGEVFVAVDRMSRDGRLLVRRSNHMSYELTLPPQLASPRSPSRQEEP
jgi:DNA-binding transcriptional regulator PaaX